MTNRPIERIDEVWRAALWILQALPPSRRSQPPTLPPLRRRKAEALVTAVGYSKGAANLTLFEEIIPNVPFFWPLLDWAAHQEIESPVLDHWLTWRMGYGHAMLEAAGSHAAVHAALTAFARRRVAEPDTAFSETAIRIAIVADLLAGS